MNRIQEIFENEITLKSDKWIPYFDVYERYFRPFVDKNFTMIEVGVQGGGSMQLWRNYFGSNAKIIGIDVDPACQALTQYYDSNTNIIIGDQASADFWDNVLPSVGPIDIFIDDGGHTVEQQIMTFNKVFPQLREGGVYLCEDTHTNFYNSIFRNSFVQHSYDAVTAMHRHWGDVAPKEQLASIIKDLYSVSFYDSMIVFEKKKRDIFDRKIVNEDGIKCKHFYLAGYNS